MSQLPSDSEARLARAHAALLGLAVGDALGGFFEFSHGALGRRVLERRVPAGPWRWTDDTQMALSLFAVLRVCGAVDQGRLAASLAARYERGRGYGMAMRALVRRLRAGEPWRAAAAGLFQSQGSFGNGCASRVAPVGAYFADDPELACLEAARSAEVTHAHPEALAGARAVAAAAASACLPLAGGEGGALLDTALAQTPPSLVRDGLLQARCRPAPRSGRSPRCWGTARTPPSRRACRLRSGAPRRASAATRRRSGSHWRARATATAPARSSARWRPRRAGRRRSPSSGASAASRCPPGPGRRCQTRPDSDVVLRPSSVGVPRALRAPR